LKLSKTKKEKWLIKASKRATETLHYRSERRVVLKGEPFYLFYQASAKIQGGIDYPD
jgi:hypothetical protein